MSLEVQVRRPERREVDRDDEAGAVVQRRLQWAEEHGKGRTRADHRVFDATIRRPVKPVVVPALGHAGARAADLKRMMVWREVLGEPIALRDSDH